jgi:GT2 family glycosyltransferase
MDHNISNKNIIDISIIIVNYNLAKEIEDCLNSLLQFINADNQIKYEVIIVDNNSPDQKLAETEKKFNQDIIKFYYLDENIGFGKGCNYGFSKSSGKYLCFLNPDTIIKENIFTPIINLFKNDNSIGIIGPKQQVRKPFFDFSAGFYPNIVFELFNLIGVGVFFEGFLVYLLTRVNQNKVLEVDWILGACIFIKSNLFREIGGFDKDYFMFYEEVDLCKRVSNKGYKIIYSQKHIIHHIGSVSGKKDYKLYTIRTYSSKYIYISKHYNALHKYFMISLLYTQLFSQIIIWLALFPFNQTKSKQKLNAFIFLIKHKLKLE